MDRTRASRVSVVDLVGILVHCRKAVNTDDYSDVGVSVLCYAGVGCQSPAIQMVSLAREVVPEHALPISGCD